LPVIPIEDPAMATAGEVARSTPRFCHVCGSPWQVGWRECLPCQSLAPPPLDATPADGGLGSIKSAAGLYFTLLGVCMIGFIASMADAPELSVDFGVSIGLSIAVLLWSVFTWRDVLPSLRRLGHPLWLAAGVGTGILTFVGVMAFFGVLQSLLHLPEEKMSTPYLDAGFGWWMVVLMIAVQPAVFEELAFRGTILSALSRALRPTEAVFVGAAMFMILHLAPLRFPHTLVMGVAAGFLRLRTGSLYPCVLLHFTHNGLCVAAERFDFY
jgi:membrane protease YdiL (CAAX protease family)